METFTATEGVNYKIIGPVIDVEFPVRRFAKIFIQH